MARKTTPKKQTAAAKRRFLKRRRLLVKYLKQLDGMVPGIKDPVVRRATARFAKAVRTAYMRGVG